MRDIKFRVWFDNEMLSLSEAMHKEFAVVQHNYSGGFNIEKGFEGVEIMQYTCLKDKNGIEIYEGDILGYGENVPAREVIFENGAFRLSDSTNHADQIIVIDTAKRLLVTGNIHQNPELLD